MVQICVQELVDETVGGARTACSFPFFVTSERLLSVSYTIQLVEPVTINANTMNADNEASLNHPHPLLLQRPEQQNMTQMFHVHGHGTCFAGNNRLLKQSSYPHVSRFSVHCPLICPSHVCVHLVLSKKREMHVAVPLLHERKSSPCSRQSMPPCC